MSKEDEHSKRQEQELAAAQEAKAKWDLSTARSRQELARRLKEAKHQKQDMTESTDKEAAMESTAAAFFGHRRRSRSSSSERWGGWSQAGP